jgi:hypothetical protein
MPSESFKNFQHVFKDVKRLAASHAKLKSGQAGKQGLGHITKSGFVLLCAAWEVYNEDLVCEIVKKHCEFCLTPADLDLGVQKLLAGYTKVHKHELKVLELAGDKWKDVYKELAQERAYAVNTPKPEQLRSLYQQVLAIEDVTTLWGDVNSVRQIEQMVVDRGAIAHGRYGFYIKSKYFEAMQALVLSIVRSIDSAFCDHIKRRYGKQPWKKTYT